MQGLSKLSKVANILTSSTRHYFDKGLFQQAQRLTDARYHALDIF